MLSAANVVVQSLSHVQLLATPWTCSMPGFLVLHRPLSRWCHPAISSSVIPFSCLHQGVGSSHQVAEGLELHLQHQSFQWYSGFISFKIWQLWSPCCPRDSQKSSPALQFKSISSSALRLLYGPTLTSVHDYWKNHSFVYMNLCQPSNVSAFKYAA